MISPEQEAKILRYYHVEQWRIGTIATQLGLHRDTVARVLAQAGLPRIVPSQRPKMIDPYMPFIMDTLAEFPNLTAARLYDMVRARGYPGAKSQFRHLIACYRPKPRAEAYLRLRTLPGEQAQVDWGSFGHIETGRARRPLMAFVIVLSWSRLTYLQFFTNANTASFIRGHVAAFESWGGVPRVVLYDNLKSAVLERQGDAIRFNPELLSLSAHYHFEPRPVAVARGNEKGRVERAIRYIRHAFFAGRRFESLDDLNAQARDWCAQEAQQRKCPEDGSITVHEAWEQERERLIALPDNAYETEEIVAVNIGKTPYARFDLNDYSVPHTHVRRTLSIRASETQVRILDDQTVLATHRRSYDRDQQIEQPEHIADLVDHKRSARQHRASDYLIRAVPECAQFLALAAEKGEPVGRTANTLSDFLERYGAREVRIAVQEALERGVPHPNSVRLTLERRRHEQHEPVPLGVQLPDHVRERDSVVVPHELQGYDSLLETDNDQH